MPRFRRLHLLPALAGIFAACNATDITERRTPAGLQPGTDLGSTASPPAVSISIGTDFLNPGSCTSVSAYSTGFDTEPIYKFYSYNPAVASFSPNTGQPYNTLCGAAEGFTTVWVEATGSSGSVSTSVESTYLPITVGQPVRSVAITPSSVTLPINGTAQLKADAVDQFGGRRQMPATWSSLQPTIAVVSSNGLVTAKAPGGATIHATISGFTGSATVAVNTTATIVGPSPIRTAGTYTYTPSVAFPGSYTYSWHVRTYGTAQNYFSSGPSVSVAVQKSTGQFDVMLTVFSNGSQVAYAMRLIGNLIPGACPGKKCP